MTVAFLVFASPCATCVTLMHGYDGSAAAVGHYFEGTVPHFPLYSPSDDNYRTSITAVQILV